jgi:hypothetical protein
MRNSRSTKELERIFMNTLFTRVAAVAGLLLSAVAGQAAQKFDVNFNFNTPAGEHAAGMYAVEVRDNVAGATKIVYLRHVETGKAVMFYPTSGLQKLNAEGPARLAFKCGDKGCNLAEIWSNANYGYTVRQRKLTPAEAERMTAVVVPASSTASE